MKKILFISLFSSLLLGASFDNLKIDAKKFKAKKNVLVFEKSVKVTRNKDYLKANKLILTFKTDKNNNKQIERYSARGLVELKIKEHNNILIVKGDEVVYSPLLKKYVIYGNGYIKDTKNKRELSGDKIFIDLARGTTQISGSGQAPVEFIIKAN